MEPKNSLIRIIKVRSGEYSVEFIDEKGLCEYEKLEIKFNVIKIILYLLCIISFIFLLSNNFGGSFLILICIIIIIYIYIYCLKKMNNFNYKLIRRTLMNSSCRVVYENETTGTISYVYKGKRYSISVFRGYNSKWR